MLLLSLTTNREGEDGAKLFLELCRGGMRGNGHKLEHGKLQSDIKKNISHEDGREWEKSEGILETLKTVLDKILTNLTELDLF